MELKTVMVWAYVTISFSFCVFFYIVSAIGLWVGRWYYPIVLVGEMICFMIQWGFLFYIINIYGSPCQCCDQSSCCYTEAVLDVLPEVIPIQIGHQIQPQQIQVVSQPQYANIQTQPQRIVYQLPNNQQAIVLPTVPQQQVQNAAFVSTNPNQPPSYLQAQGNNRQQF